jgi:hypothetical protein
MTELSISHLLTLPPELVLKTIEENFTDYRDAVKYCSSNKNLYGLCKQYEGRLMHQIYRNNLLLPDLTIKQKLIIQQSRYPELDGMQKKFFPDFVDLKVENDINGGGDGPLRSFLINEKYDFPLTLTLSTPMRQYGTFFLYLMIREGREMSKSLKKKLLVAEKVRKNSKILIPMYENLVDDFDEEFFADLSVWKWFFDNGVDPNKEFDATGKPLLYLAAVESQFRIATDFRLKFCQFLINNGANPNFVDQDGLTIFQKLLQLARENDNQVNPLEFFYFAELFLQYNLMGLSEEDLLYFQKLKNLQNFCSSGKSSKLEPFTQKPFNSFKRNELVELGSNCFHLKSLNTWLRNYNTVDSSYDPANYLNDIPLIQNKNSSQLDRFLSNLQVPLTLKKRFFDREQLGEISEIEKPVTSSSSIGPDIQRLLDAKGGGGNKKKLSSRRKKRHSRRGY